MSDGRSGIGGLFDTLFGIQPVRGPCPTLPWTVPEIGIEMMWIEPGGFMMGSPLGEDGRSDGETAHLVSLTRGFWLGKYQVTQGQWTALVDANPSSYKTCGPDAPVERVRWVEAMEFCARLTKIEKKARRLPAGYEYCLPTEAQWEYACRAGTTGPYGGTGNLGDMGWFHDNAEGKTEMPVGKKQPSAWGLYDMHGNVCEWCADWFGPYQATAVVDPTGPEKGAARVLRGGSYCSIARYCRAAIRFSDFPSNRLDDLGFRIALRSVAPTKHHHGDAKTK